MLENSRDTSPFSDAGVVAHPSLIPVQESEIENCAITKGAYIVQSVLTMVLELEYVFKYGQHK